MKINSITNLNNVYSIKSTNSTSFESAEVNSGLKIYNGEIKYPQIYFGSNLTTKKIPCETDKLIKLLDEYLEQPEDLDNMPREEFVIMIVDKLSRFHRRQDERLEQLQQRVLDFKNDRSLSRAQVSREGHALLKEINRLKNEKFYPYKFQKKVVVDESIDLLLINKFKTALLNDNYDLRSVFRQYYSGLENISTLGELSEKYPKISIPKRPEDIVAKKITNTLPRKFYQQLDEMLTSKRPYEETAQFINDSVIENINKICYLKPELTNEETQNKIGMAVAMLILDQYDRIKEQGTFSSVPVEQRPLQIDNIDLQLLSVDYDDFVLTVIKEQYLNGKKPSDVVYSNGTTVVKVSNLNDSPYKFDKISEKIRKIFTISDKIKTAQRSYNQYDREDFIKRLEFYAEKFDENEELLEKIIDFNSCKFTKEDMKFLSAFLNELDKVWDGSQSLADAVDVINQKGFRPKETERLAQIEYEQAIEHLKAEQKRNAQLKNKQEQFDNVINILYANNLNYCAEICSKYRPKSLDDINISNSEFVVDLINKYLKDEKIEKPAELQKDIVRWNTYLECSNSVENEVFKKAKEYATDPKTNEADVFKIGQYIINSQIIEHYDESSKYLDDLELLNKIMDNIEDRDLQIKYFCKLENLGEYGKSSVQRMLELFDMKNSTDKMILKYLIENNYNKVETKAHPKINNKEVEDITVTIAPSAKEQLYDYYKFPKCMEYYREFEEAMVKFADDEGASGIKYLGKYNKKRRDMYELKIVGYDDRLYSYNDSYYFEDFSPIGLHKKKKN